VTFLVGDERTPVVPANEERGYVCRRMLRRAVYFGRQLGIEGPFMVTLANAFVDAMKDSYPELERQRNFITEIIGPEEERFGQTLERGLSMLEQFIKLYPDEKRFLRQLNDGQQTLAGQIDGHEAFLLHDTYGFPVDLTRDIAAQHGFTVDLEGFEAEMERQRERARAAVGSAEYVASEAFYSSLVADATLFTGYGETETATEVVAIANAGESSPAAATVGQDIELFLAATPFYPEGGGQVGDRGEIAGPNGRVEVLDTQRVAERLIVHRGRVVEGQIAVGDQVTATVDPHHRAATKRNHTATHLLHAALRQVLGNDVRQAGSLVAPDRLRFDITYAKSITAEQLAEVESLVNEKVRQNAGVHTRETSMDEAMADGVLAFFGDKYGDRVRVVEVNTVIPRFSAELCGGTHCERTGEIGAIIVIGESSIGSGMRRIEALTGEMAEKYIREQLRTLDDLAVKLGTQRNAVAHKIESLVAESDDQRKKIEKLERSLASGAGKEDLMSKATQVDGVRVLATRVEAASIDGLRFTGDSVRKSLESGVAVIGAAVDDKPMFVAIVSKDLVERGLHAGNLLKRVAAAAGGNAGGRPDMAQGGGRDLSKLDEALGVVAEAVKEMLASK
jgi:alanyl-tRNA synthetase